jgi:hypothetical protein
LEALITALAFMPGFNPSSLAESLVIEARERQPSLGGIAARKADYREGCPNNLSEPALIAHLCRIRVAPSS